MYFFASKTIVNKKLVVSHYYAGSIITGIFGIVESSYRVGDLAERGGRANRLKIGEDYGEIV